MGGQNTRIDQPKKFPFITNTAKFPRSQDFFRQKMSQKILSINKPIQCSKQTVLQKKNDLRVQVSCNQYPFSAIALLTSQNDYNCNGYGTAVLVNHNIALTAAHTIYSFQDSIFLKNVSLTFGIKQDKANTYQVAIAFIPKQYMNQQTKNHNQYDFAVLLLNTQQRLGQKYGTLPVSFQKLQTKQKIGVYGYPTDLNKLKSIQMQPNSASKVKWIFGCQNQVENIFGNIIQHNVDTCAGQSGAPILRKSIIYNQYQIVGIHIGSNFYQNHNRGVLITPQIINKMNDWIKKWREPSQQRVVFIQKNCLNQITHEAQNVDLTDAQHYKNQGNKAFDKKKYQQSLKNLRKALKLYQRFNRQYQSRQILKTIKKIFKSYNYQEGFYECQKRLYSNFKYQIQEIVPTLQQSDLGAGVSNSFDNSDDDIMSNKLNKQSSQLLYYDQKIQHMQKNLKKQQVQQYLNLLKKVFQIYQNKVEDFKKSQKICLKAIKACEKHYGKNSLKCSFFYNRLGRLYSIIYRRVQSREYLMQTLNLYLGTDNNQIQRALNLYFLGQHFQQQKDYKLKIQFFEQAKKKFQLIPLIQRNKSKQYFQICKCLQIQK